MSDPDDEEEEFFRQQEARLNKKSSGNNVDRGEDDGQGGQVQGTDPKKRGVFGMVPTPGISKFLLGKGGLTSKGVAGKPPTAPRATGPPQRPAAPVGAKPPQDEDSDEDMLSSSEDEADVTRRAALQRQETRVIRGDSVARAPPTVRPSPQYKTGPGNDDGRGEAELWDDVEEEELVRKVREMRDSRSVGGPRAPAPQPSASKRPDVAADSELNDLLGQGRIDLKSLSLANVDDPELSPHEYAPHVEKLLFYSETFKPRYYLAQLHRDTGVQELEFGRSALKKDIAERKEQLKKLVKDNFDIFISCKDIIDDIHARLERMEEGQDGAGTEKLADSIQDCDEVARRAFSPLLERQAQVDRIRSVQGLLQRFRTLFNLPSVIRGFVRKGEYDSAVREFVKAKSLNLNFPGNSGILKKVQEEVDKVVQEFKEVLYSQMADPNAELVQVENKIRLLIEIEPEADPVWHYLQLQDRRIRGLLEGAQLEADSRLEALQQRLKEKQQAEARWKQLQSETSQGSEVDLTLLLGDEHLLDEAPSVSSEEEVDALHARLIRRLTAVLRQQVPRLWKLALSIFAGRFANTSQSQDRFSEQMSRSPLHYQQYPTPKSDEGLSGRYTRHSQDEVTVMILGIISSYETKVLAAFTQLEIATHLRKYMQESVGEVASLCNLLKTRDSAPVQAVGAVQQLRVEVTRRFVKRLCFITRGAAVELADEENWIPAPTVQRAGSPYAISTFPLDFEETMTCVLDHLTDVLAQLASEEAPENRMHGTENVMGALRQMYDSVKSTFFESFVDFCECLEKMSRNLPQARQPGQMADDIPEGLDGGDEEGLEVSVSMEEDTGEGDFKGLQVGVPIKTADQRILMLLSNAGFCRTHVVPQLAEKYHHLWQDPMEEGGRGSTSGYSQRQASSSAEAARLLSDLEKHFLDLEMSLGDKYIEIKAGHLGVAVIKYLEDGTTWATAPPVKGLRDSALELMHPLVAVHAEVYAGCRPFVDKAINMLADGLMDALNQVAMQHLMLQQLDSNAFCQLSLELDYFESVLHNFTTESLSGIVYQLREMLCQRTMDGIDAHLTDMENERGIRRSGRSVGEEMGSLAEGALPQTIDELKQMAGAVSRELLPGELKRTRVNVYCFRGSDESEVGGNPSLGPDILGVAPSSAFRSPPVDLNSNILSRTYSNLSSGSASSLSRINNQSGVPGTTGRSPNLLPGGSLRGSGSSGTGYTSRVSETLGRRGTPGSLDQSANYGYGSGLDDESPSAARRSADNTRLDAYVIGGSQTSNASGRPVGDRLGRSTRLG